MEDRRTGAHELDVRQRRRVLVFLLPGFVAAAVFYSLTSHPKPGAFDRVIQALIFTVVGQSLVVLVEPVTGEKVSR